MTYFWLTGDKYTWRRKTLLRQTFPMNLIWDEEIPDRECSSTSIEHTYFQWFLFRILFICCASSIKIETRTSYLSVAHSNLSSFFFCAGKTNDSVDTPTAAPLLLPASMQICANKISLSPWYVLNVNYRDTQPVDTSFEGENSACRYIQIKICLPRYIYVFIDNAVCIIFFSTFHFTVAVRYALSTRVAWYFSFSSVLHERNHHLKS